MARLFHEGLVEKRISAFLAGVRSICLLLIIGRKQIEHFSRDRTLQPAATPVTNMTAWLNNRPTVFREIAKKPARN
jgi:hypothetical protein